MQVPNANDVIKDVPYILDAFSELVKEDPNKLLLVNPATKTTVTRGRADELSARLYRYLQGKGVTTESHVMICLPRGEMPMLAILGVLKSGAAFTLVEDTYVPERIEYIRKDFGVDVFLDIATWHEAMREPPLWGFQKAGDKDLCLAVYTSGTTGAPKGVLNEYGTIKFLYLSLLAPRAALGNVGRVTAMVAPLNFVAAIKRVFDLFYWGDTMHVLPYATLKNPTKLKRYVLEKFRCYSVYEGAERKRSCYDILNHTERLHEPGRWHAWDGAARSMFGRAGRYHGKRYHGSEHGGGYGPGRLPERQHRLHGARQQAAQASRRLGDQRGPR